MFQLDLTGATVTAAFGYGTNSGNEQSHALAYIESEAAAVVPFLHKSSKCMYVAKVTMATRGSSWSKKVCISSFWSYPRYLIYDELARTLYFASDFSNTYFFVCKMRPSDGTATYCAKYDGDGADYPY